MDIKTMMAQAKKMQADIERKKAEIATREFSATKQGVSVVMNGAYEVLRVKVEPLLLDPEDAEIIEGLLVLAVNDVRAQVDEAIAAVMPKGAY